MMLVYATKPESVVHAVGIVASASSSAYGGLALAASKIGLGVSSFDPIGSLHGELSHGAASAAAAASTLAADRRRGLHHHSFSSCSLRLLLLFMCLLPHFRYTRLYRFRGDERYHHHVHLHDRHRPRLACAL